MHALGVHNWNMNTIRDLILTAAGGMMHTATLNLLTVIIAMIFVVVFGVGMVYALSMHKVKDARPKTLPIINAQGEMK